MEEVSNVIAIKRFFNLSNTEMSQEWKSLSKEEREWFGQECARELGLSIKG